MLPSHRHSSPSRAPLKIFIILAILTSITLLSSWIWYTNKLQPLTKEENIQHVTIPPGSSANEVAQILKEQNLIKNIPAFKIYTKLNNTQNQLRAGQFKVSSNWSTSQIVKHLSTGGFEGVWITFLEGWRREQVALELANSQLNNFDVQEFMKLTADKEGYLFPDTYLIPTTYNIQNVITLMTNTFETKIQPIISQSTTVPKQLGLNQAIVLSSILEREAAKDKDYPIVAGILLKRIQNSWPIQADATLQYAKINNQLATNNYQLIAISNWWPTPYAEDKQINSAYNTYQNLGLPPTPISNPGIESIKAVLNPKTTNYWYYITDMQGNMHYAETLEQHNANVDKYLK